MFDFGTADNYYRTQSSNQFLEHIRIPTLLVQAMDDPMVPFAMYRHPALEHNAMPALDGRGAWRYIWDFSRAAGPRFWLDALITSWLAEKK